MSETRQELRFATLASGEHLAWASIGRGPALLRAPERFEGVVTVGGNWLRGRPGQHDAFLPALRADYPRAIAGFVDRCFPEPDSAEIRRWGRQILMRASPEHAVQLLENRDALTVEDRLGEIRVPTLALHGALDAIVPVEASRRSTRCSRARTARDARPGGAIALRTPARPARSARPLGPPARPRARVLERPRPPGRARRARPARLCYAMRAACAVPLKGGDPMSSRLSRLAVGVIALMIAGGAVACPGAKNKTSADQGHGSGALVSSTSGRT